MASTPAPVTAAATASTPAPVPAAAAAAAAAEARKVCRPDAPLCSALPVCGTQDGASMSQSCRVMLACLDDGECRVSLRV